MTVLECKQDAAEAAKQPAAINIRNVLYATDFSNTAEAAFPYATAICRKFGATLHTAHVLSDTNLSLMVGGVDYVTFETLYSDAQNAAEEKVKEVTNCVGEIPSRTYVRHGQVWTNLRGIIVENGIDLIVVGTHGRTGLGKLLLGSVAEDILRHAPCPVLTVGPKTCGHSRLPEFDRNSRDLALSQLELRQILYATDFTPASLRVAPVAIELAQQFDARLTLMHVLEEYSKLADRLTSIEDGVQRLQAMVPKDATLPYVPEIVTEFGSPWQCIVNKAAEHDTDLIVLGAHPVDGTTHLPWSTVHRVVAHATCPVLTVPA